MYKGTCGTACCDIIQLPEEQQKELRRGQKEVNRIFNKARLRDWLHEDNDQSGRARVIGVQGRTVPKA